VSTLILTLIASAFGQLSNPCSVQIDLYRPDPGSVVYMAQEIDWANKDPHRVRRDYTPTTLHSAQDGMCEVFMGDLRQFQFAHGGQQGSQDVYMAVRVNGVDDLRNGMIPLSDTQGFTLLSTWSTDLTIKGLQRAPSTTVDIVIFRINWGEGVARGPREISCTAPEIYPGMQGSFSCKSTAFTLEQLEWRHLTPFAGMEPEVSSASGGSVRDYAPTAETAELYQRQMRESRAFASYAQSIMVEEPVQAPMPAPPTPQIEPEPEHVPVAPTPQSEPAPEPTPAPRIQPDLPEPQDPPQEAVAVVDQATYYDDTVRLMEAFARKLEAQAQKNTAPQAVPSE
jgi:hypothetical protein